MKRRMRARGQNNELGKCKGLHEALMTVHKGLLDALMTNDERVPVLHHAMMTAYPWEPRIIGMHLE